MLSEYSKYAKIAIKDTPINIKNAKISKKQKFTNFATFLRFILFTNELVTTFSLIASSTFASIYICLHIFITCLGCIFIHKYIVIFFNRHIIPKKTAPKNNDDKNISFANNGWLRMLLVPRRNNNANITNINFVNAK